MEQRRAADSRQAIRKFELPDELRAELEATMAARVDRALKLVPHPMVANTYFAPLSRECFRLFRDGYFFACIALSQSIAEALVRYISSRLGLNPKGEFEKQVARIIAKGNFSTLLGPNLLSVWQARDDFHHLNPKVAVEAQTLEIMAAQKIALLNDIEAEVFGFDVQDGRTTMHYPLLWPGDEQFVEVDLRIDY